MHHRQVRAVGGPVGGPNILQDLARRPAGQRRSRQRAIAQPCARMQDNGHLTLRRNRMDVAGRQPEWAELRAPGARREKLHRISVPLGGINYGLAIGSSPGRDEIPAPEGYTPEAWLR